MTALATTLQAFFTDRLVRQRQVGLRRGLAIELFRPQPYLFPPKERAPIGGHGAAESDRPPAGMLGGRRPSPRRPPSKPAAGRASWIFFFGPALAAGLAPGSRRQALDVRRANAA